MKREKAAKVVDALEALIEVHIKKERFPTTEYALDQAHRREELIAALCGEIPTETP